MEKIKQNKNLIIVAVISLVVGIGLGSIADGYGKYGKDKGDGYSKKMMMKKMGDMKGGYMDMSHSGHDMGDMGMMGESHSMDTMMKGMTMRLEGKSGAEFDKVFLQDMIVHHQGAVEMAKMALQNAGRQEVKDLSNAIITAQEKEIAQMQSWLAEMK